MVAVVVVLAGGDLLERFITYHLHRSDEGSLLRFFRRPVKDSLLLGLHAASPAVVPPGRVSVGGLQASVGTLDRWRLAVGAKASILGRGLVRFDVMGSLNDAGITPGLTTVIGFEYAF